MALETKTQLAHFILTSPRRLALPLGIYAGLTLTGASVRTTVTSSAAQAETALALADSLAADFLLTAMDLSVEAEAFGCAVRLMDEEIPTVTGRLVTGAAEIATLSVPEVGTARTRVYLEAARQLVVAQTGKPVLGGLIGPFSLAGRLLGMSEALAATAAAPELLFPLLEKATAFLIQYALAFRETGAAGIIMAEPAAGLLSPRALGRFSSTYVQQLVAAVQTETFAVILHNCGARLVHLPKLLEAGAELYHFGAPMALPAALEQVTGQVILAGNLDPTAIFHDGTPAEVAAATADLLAATAAHPNFVIASGCDLPPGTPLANLVAFYQTVRAGSIR